MSRPPHIDILDALSLLGEMWGFDRPLTYAELASVLGIEAVDPGRTIRRWAEGVTRPSGPALVALQMLLDGALPPDDIEKSQTARKSRLALTRLRNERLARR